MRVFKIFYIPGLQNYEGHNLMQFRRILGRPSPLRRTQQNIYSILRLIDFNAILYCIYVCLSVTELSLALINLLYDQCQGCQACRKSTFV